MTHENCRVRSFRFSRETSLEALFVVDRLNTEKLIEKAEEEGEIVVCSRWAESAGLTPGSVDLR